MPLVPAMLNHSCAQLSFSQSECLGTDGSNKLHKQEAVCMFTAFSITINIISCQKHHQQYGSFYEKPIDSFIG